MPQITYIQPDGSRREIDAAIGTSVMQAAITDDVSGILGECGGSLACATCHVMVEPEWLDRLPPVSETEGDMLDFAATERTPESRLSCQIALTPELDGLVVRVPATQV